MHGALVMLLPSLQSGSVDDRGGLNVGSNNSHPGTGKKKKRKFITITKNVFGEVCEWQVFSIPVFVHC